MDLSNINEVKAILEKNGFSFKKSLGQNFLIDGTVCPKMAESAVKPGFGALEIGPGAGVLTRELAKRFKKVVAIELDERLKNVLKTTLADFDNTEVIFGDALKIDLKKLIAEKFAGCEGVAVCANLPYYITSPLIMTLLQSNLPIDSLTVMVQKEAADRICAKVGSRDSGAVTVAVNYYSSAEKLFDVPKTSFFPSPKVDSAVIRLNIRKTPAITLKSEEKFFMLVKSAFAQRRKTFLNTVSNTLGIDKEHIKKCLNEVNLSESIRGEAIDMETLARLSDIIF